MHRICKRLMVSIALSIVSAALAAPGAAQTPGPQDWPTFRHDNARTAAQPVASPLSNPAKVGSLAVKWVFPHPPQAVSGPFIDTYAEADQQHFAWLAQNGEIWDAFYCPKCSGNPWRIQKINGAGGVTPAAPPSVSVPFVNVYSGNDQQHFAWRDKSGIIWDSFYARGNNSWHCQQINGPNAKNPNCPQVNLGTTAPAASEGPFIDTYVEANQQHFAYTDANGEIWDAFYCPGCSGDPWRIQKINGAGGVTPAAPPSASVPFVNVYSGNDQQHFAWRDKSGLIWDSFYQRSNNSWHCQQISGPNANNRSCPQVNLGSATPAAVDGPFIDTYAEANQQHFAWLAAGGEIWDAFYCPGCSGDPWRIQKINGTGGVSPAAPLASSAPFLNVYSGNDQQHFAYRDSAGLIWDAFYARSNNSWHCQQINGANKNLRDCPRITLEGDTANPPLAASAPFVDTYLGNNQQHVAWLAAGSGGEIWDAFYCPDCRGGNWRQQEIGAAAQTSLNLGAFDASPIAVGGQVFIGNDNGYFYAIDAATGDLNWQYPPAGQQALLGGDGKWRYGIQSSAAYWDRKPDGAVIFAAQDPALGPDGANGSYGSARLFALDAKTGALIWKSDRIAEINGDTDNSDTEIHQRIGYSPPLIQDDKVYLGIQSFENPIQIGRVVAVELATGKLVAPSQFQFQAVGTTASPRGSVRGGGVWNGPASDGSDIYFTTGNSNRDEGNPPQTSEPNPNHGVSLIKIDKTTGSLKWAYKTVPFSSDCDADWSAGATVMNTSCGALIASVQKDGWSYGIEPGAAPACPLAGHSWQFPPTSKGCLFPANTCPSSQDQGSAAHGDDDYRRPGAAWNDVFIVRTGGESRMQDGVAAGYSRLHALNACAAAEPDRVRWLADIPHSSGGSGAFGAATVTGGIVFVGTDQGHLVVLGDPSVTPAAGSRCADIDYPTAAACKAAGFKMVPIPKILADVAIPDGGSLVAIRNEPVLAGGRVFVATKANHLYMLQP